MNKEIIAQKEALLYDYLREILTSLSKNNIKSLLLRKMVSVNGKIVTAYNYSLKVNDIISIKNNVVESNVTGDIKIIYEDKDIIVVDKPSGILTIATETNKDNESNLYSTLSKYIKRKNSNGKIFIVHRLDKDTSGVILFAKNEKIKNRLQESWNDIATRIYCAVVIGKTREEETLKSYLKDNVGLMTYAAKDGKLAITKYKKISSNDKYSLLDINIETGRRNQIRFQMSEINHPILGDSKYGKKDKTIKRMMLHAKTLDIIDPITKEKKHFESPVPKIFYKMMNDK